MSLRSVDANSPSSVRTLAGIAFGFLLFWLLTYVNGYLAAVAIPQEYFAFFGRERLGVGLFFIHLTLHAIPSFLIALVWCLAIGCFHIDRPNRTATLCLLGYLLALSFFMVTAVVEFALLRVEGKVPFLVYARQVFFPSWWATPGVLAVPLAILFAVSLLSRQATARPPVSLAGA